MILKRKISGDATVVDVGCCLLLMPVVVVVCCCNCYYLLLLCFCYCFVLSVMSAVVLDSCL